MAPSKSDFSLEHALVLLKPFLSSIPEVVSYVDRSLTYRFASDSYRAWLGVSPDSMVGRSISEVAGPEVFHVLKPLLQRAFRGECVLTEIDTPHPKGGRRTVLMQYYPDMDSNGSCRGVVGIGRDVTQARRAVHQLAESEKRLRYTLESAPLGIVQVDDQTRFVTANPAFERFIGYSAYELRRMTMNELIHPEDQELSPSPDLFQLLPEAVLKRIKLRYVTRRGQTKWASLNCCKFRDETNGQDYMLAIVEDLTDALQKENQLIESTKMAALGVMASGIAHEVNNPLAVIQGLATQLLRMMEKPAIDAESMRKKLNSIVATSDRIAKIVKGLRYYSRSSGQDPMLQISLHHLIEETLVICRDRFCSENVRLEEGPIPPVVLNCRPTQISQVLLNILNNAIDAVDGLNEKWIRIECQVHHANQVRISITDSGRGIAKTIADRIMDPFFTTKEIGRGTGLGLSISKGIIEDHHGRLLLNKNSLHTCFVIDLPVQAPQPDLAL